MTERDLASGCDRADDVAAYALGALSDHEARALRAHLEACEPCRAELGRMESTAAALPLSAPPLAVPRQLRRRVLADVRADARRGAAPRRAPRSWISGAPALAGVLCVAAVAIVIVIAVSSGPTRIATRVYRASVTFPAARVSLRVGSGTPELVAEHLPAPPGGKIYEVWVARSGRAPLATSALFDVNSSGRAAVAVPASLKNASAVLVTAEPLGGTTHPTTPAVIVARLR
jgi:anti-sigma-K factor RskA